MVASNDVKKPDDGYHRVVPAKTLPDRVKPSFSVVSDPAVKVTRKALRAYDRLFGAHLPHYSMARLNGFNSRALTVEFKNDVLKVLSEKDPAYYYRDPEEAMRAATFKSYEMDAEGNLLVGWRTVATKPNPHHIVPQSRLWTWNAKNLRHIDRAVHDDFHTLFTNLTPVEQLLHLLCISSDELNPLFVLEVLRLVEETDLSYYYRKGVVERSAFSATAS